VAPAAALADAAGDTAASSGSALFETDAGDPLRALSKEELISIVKGLRVDKQHLEEKLVSKEKQVKRV